MPDDLAAKVRAKLQEQPKITWHYAIRLIIDPDAPPDNDDDDRLSAEYGPVQSPGEPPF